MNDCVKLLLWLSWKSTTAVSLVLWVLLILCILVVLPFGWVHFDSSPCSGLVIVCWLVDLRGSKDLVVIVVSNLGWSDSGCCWATTVWRWSMAANHLILWVLWTSIWSSCRLDGLMSAVIAVMWNSHVHFILNVILIVLLSHLTLVPHVMPLHKSIVSRVTLLLLAYLGSIIPAILLLVLPSLAYIRQPWSLLPATWWHTSTLPFVLAIGHFDVLDILLCIPCSMRNCLQLRSIIHINHFNRRSNQTLLIIIWTNSNSLNLHSLLNIILITTHHHWLRWVPLRPLSIIRIWIFHHCIVLNFGVVLVLGSKLIDFSL